MTYIAQCLNSYISVKIDYIPLLRTCGGWASQNNHSSVKKKEPRQRVYWQVQQIYEKYTSCFHTILVMLCHHCYHPSYEDTERQFFSIFYVVLCYVCGISVLLFSLQFSQLWLPAIVQKHIGFIGDSELRYVAAFHSASALNFGLQSAMNSSNS